jgi:hypothetical protein
VASELSPFGPDGRAIAFHAALMLGHLSTVVEGDWQEPDIAALEDWAGLEVAVRGIHGGGYGKLVEAFGQLWSGFHTALPFTEPERGWLRRIYGERPAGRMEDIPRNISHREETIVSAGVHKVVNGHDLMERWLRWRRKSGEFSDEDTLDLACEALSRIVQLVAPGRSLEEIRSGDWTA